MAVKPTVGQNEDTVKLSITGLSDDIVVKMREKYGSNMLTPKKRRSFLSHFISNFNDPIIKILLGALLLNVLFSFRHSNWPETIGVAAAVLIATLVSTVSEYSSCRAAERLSAGDAEKCFVRRNGKLTEILTNEIVTGDVVLLTPGMMIPADGALVSGKIVCNQSALTGEGRDIKKNVTSPSRLAELYVGTERTMDAGDSGLVFRGATVISEGGEFLVLRTGDKTLYGAVAAGLQDEAPESPLKKKLSVLANEISFIGYIAAGMVAVSYLFNVFFIDSGLDISCALARMRNLPYLFHELLCALTLAVSILVVAVPEGLPMMITVVLSSNMKRMLRHGVLVKRMVGIETAGSMSILFTDKTGTLTEGKMTVREIITPEEDYKSVTSLIKHKELYNILRISSKFLPAEGTRNSADEAAKSFFGISDTADKTYSVIGRIPFESKKRFAAVTVKSSEKNLTYLRGAPEIIIPAAVKYISADGTIKDLSGSVLEKLKEKWMNAAGRGGRIIASAYTDGDKISSVSSKNMPELVLCGLYYLEDRLRHDAAESVKQARSAGIKVIMMTGDNKETAAAIASECGILREGELVLTGDMISSMNDGEITAILPKLSVIARALPSDKLRIVKLARAAGYISGMTGDGINDAPSLRAADVGFAMGSGTDVTKEAGDIVITDNSFSSIIRAALYGRTIFRSIRKFIVFQLTMNLCATAVSFLGPFMGIEAPVTVIQMLWVNIIMDTLGALAFAGEPPRAEYMKNPPFDSSVKILTGEMVSGILLMGLYMVSLSMFFLISPFCRNMLGGTNDTYFLTAFFAFFIFCGIALSFNSRTPKLFPLSGISKNKPFIFIMTAVAAIQLGLVYFGGEMFRCTPIAASDLLKTALLALSVIPVGMIIKLFLKNRENDM